MKLQPATNIHSYILSDQSFNESVKMTSMDTNSVENISAKSTKDYCVINKKDSSDKEYSQVQEQGEQVFFDEFRTDVEKGCDPNNKSCITTSTMDTREELSGDILGCLLKFEAQNQNNENSETSVLSQKEYDESIDERLPETVTLLTTPNGGKLYLVGTAHFSVQSQKDVAMIIQAVQPHILAVELCKARIDFSNITEDVLYHNATDLSLRTLIDLVKEHGSYGFLHFMLRRMVSHVVKELGMPPGGEFRTAFEEAIKVPNCFILLADRSISITVQRAVRALSWWEIIKLCWLLYRLDLRINEQDVERYKRKSVIEEMISKLEQEYPAIERTFVKERDLYLTYKLHAATMTECITDGSTPVRVVGVVGIGHMNGIVENWGKVKSSDILPIIRVPPQSLSSKILKFTFKASLLGVAVYVGYKIIPLPYGSALQSIKSSIEGFVLKASAHPDEYEHATPSIMYIVNNIPGPGIDIEDFESEYSVGCSCTGRCTGCSCTRGFPNYIDDRIVEEKLSGPIVECNSRCNCKENCGNRLVQYGPLNSLKVLNVDKKGLGLFTSKSISKGRFICEYAGEVISIEEARRRVEANKNSMNYVLVVSEHIGQETIVTCIDPKYFGNIGRYANHSCEPNAKLIPIRVEGTTPRLCLFASRDISIDEEITFSYADGIANSVRTFSDTRCFCGSTNCVGYLPHNSI